MSTNVYTLEIITGGQGQIEVQKIFLKLSSIYPEKIGLLDLFLSKMGQHLKMPPYPNRDNKVIFLKDGIQNIV